MKSYSIEIELIDEGDIAISQQLGFDEESVIVISKDQVVTFCDWVMRVAKGSEE